MGHGQEHTAFGTALQNYKIIVGSGVVIAGVTMTIPKQQPQEHASNSGNYQQIQRQFQQESVLRVTSVPTQVRF